MHVHQTARLALLGAEVGNLDVQHLLLRDVVVEEDPGDVRLGQHAAVLLAVVGHDARRPVHVVEVVGVLRRRGRRRGRHLLLCRAVRG